MFILEIRPDHGGQDAEDFAASLTVSIVKYLIRYNYQAFREPFSELAKSFSVSTNAPLSALNWLKGCHAVQRIPKRSAARHTSTATVVVRPEVENPAVTINPNEIRIDRYRGTGKGGQKKNKTSSAIRVLHKPTGIIVTRESGRSQDANLKSALAQLEEELLMRSRGDTERHLAAQRGVLQEGMKTFTHNYQRGEVTRHATGDKWNVKEWKSGQFGI